MPEYITLSQHSQQTNKNSQRILLPTFAAPDKKIDLLSSVSIVIVLVLRCEVFTKRRQRMLRL